MLHGHSQDSVPQEYQDNMKALLAKVNVIREAWGKPMAVTSGIRTQADQERINPSAPKSNHMTGHAIDISDPDLSITTWLKSDGASLLAAQGLYCEEGNANWIHLQDVAPHSGNRWFLP